MAEFSQNSFSRISGNDAKMGYFPTDLKCVEILATHFKKTEGVYCLDPCIGEGDAVMAFSKQLGLTPIGIELNKERYRKCKEKGLEVIEGNFIETTISPQSISMCFMNPPYGFESSSEQREELLFLQKITGILSKDGILVFIIPEYIVEQNLLRFIISRYGILKVLRFPEYEYKKYKQVAFILRRKKNQVPTRQELEEILKAWPSMPTELTEGQHDIEIEPLKKERLKTFHAKEFNAEEAIEHSLDMLKNSKSKFLAESIAMEDVSRIDVGHPLMDLKPDLKYLMIASGVCHGKIAEGTPSEHLQRGTVNTVEETSYDVETGEGAVTTRAKITMTVLDRNGEFLNLM